MEYQKIANLIGDTSNQPSKFRTKNWVEINDESMGAYNVYSQLKFKTTMLKSSLCDYIEDSESFKSKIKIIGKTPNNNVKDVEIMVPLKYLSNFWRTLEMPLINCEVNIILTWSSTCVITNSNGAGTFEITDTKLYVPVVTINTRKY